MQVLLDNTDVKITDHGTDTYWRFEVERKDDAYVERTFTKDQAYHVAGVLVFVGPGKPYGAAVAMHREIAEERGWI